MSTEYKSASGSNLMLWAELLGSPFLWLCQFELNYLLVPWACSTGHRLVLNLAWIPFFIGIVVLGFRACRDYLRIGAADMPGAATSRFMTMLSLMGGLLFALATVVQAAATFIIDPCAH